ncbi:hypothetical protein F66182_2271 [Fusarium sp. NRRL 66182]|nr:hypothetical protein F66182_2271 [Fusarium sp. NRRL 66182]
MRFSAFYAAALWLTSASALAVPDVLAKIEQKLPTREPPPPKYFKPAAQNAGIKVLMQTYLATFRDLGVQTWLMHGSLLGWWWGKKVMPWDLDADVQVTEADIYFLAAYHNMSIYYYQYEGCPEGRFFQLDVNPYYKHRDRDDTLNVIDARWVDMQTGLFIDITAARYDPGHEMGEGVLYDKHDHEFKDKYVFPLLDTTFEGLPAKIPYRYKEILASEYGKASLSKTEFHKAGILIPEAGQQRRAERLNERLRGAQRANVDDSFNLDFNLDIAGLNIAASTPAAPAPAPPASSANTSAKRKRLDNEPAPPVQASGGVLRRSPRTQPEDPYELPDTSKESVAQVTEAASEEVGEPSLDIVEEPEPESQPEPEPELPSPAQSVEAPSENEADIELPVLPNGDDSVSPPVQRPSRPAQAVTSSPPDRRRNVRMSDVLSSTTRLYGGLQEEDDAPPSSSPLRSKVRRSEGAAAIRSSMSRRRVSQAVEQDKDVDELSPDRPVDHAPADDELSEPNESRTEVADADAEQIDKEPAVREALEEAQAEEEEAAVAEAIDAIEAAKRIGKKRPRTSLQSHSPDAEPEEQAEDDEPAPKRSRGRPSRSPATQKQPATKPRASTRAKSRTTEPKPTSKQVQRTKQAAKDRRISDGSAIEITVQRFVNAKKYSKGDGEEDQLAADVPFTTSGETVVDVFSQVCLEVIDGTLAKVYETLASTEDKEKKKECRIKIRALEAYKEELTSRLLQLAIHLNDWHTLRKRVRVVQREKLSLREEILRLKAEREQVALKMDAVRIKHEEDTKESKYRLDTSALMHDIDMAVERGRDAPELSRAQEKKAELANLELLVARITDEASSASSAGGMLQQVKDFNAFLERAAIALESR